ncbi:MAG: hypothetical protein KAU35_04645 [candidate division Zixibacteria bacterium]|nr:hypothetical protein [candidate division Zixibacteria bacterium]
MADQINIPGGPKKKGMSKGCMIALIVVGVLAVLVIVAGVVCYVKKDALMKAGGVTMVNSIQKELVDNPVEGVDTVQVNRVSEAFVQKLNEEELDMQRYGVFAQEIQGIMSDQVIEAAEIERFVQAMIDYFPELGELITTEEAVDSIAPEDTVSAEY